MIKELTQEQKQAKDEWYKEYRDVGTCTDSMDFEKSKEIISDFYNRLGYDEPRFRRMSSPIGCEILINSISYLHEERLGELRGELGGEFWGELWVELRGELRDELRDELRGEIRDELRGEIRDELRGELGDEFWGELRDELRGELRDELWGELWGELRDELRGELRDELRGELRDELRGELRDELRDELRGELGGELRDELQIHNRLSVQHYAYWTLFYQFCSYIGVDYGTNQDLLDAWDELSRSCMWFWPFEEICVISDRPEHLSFDDQRRLHSLNGPAVRFRDGWSIYKVHGVSVPEYVVEDPDSITVDDIESEDNTEVRRVMIEQYGTDEYLMDSGAVEVDVQKGIGTLYRKELPDDEDIVMVQVTNSTPEPDGSRKDYFLRVPPGIDDAKEAVAWTFGMEAEDYDPVVET